MAFKCAEVQRNLPALSAPQRIFFSSFRQKVTWQHPDTKPAHPSPPNLQPWARPKAGPAHVGATKLV